MDLLCPLCQGIRLTSISADLRADAYFHCLNCDLRFLNPKYRLPPEKERERYLTHNNDVDDPDYQNFVRPLFLEIRKIKPPPARGLDFGAGTGPVMTKLLRDEGYEVALYDPFFWPDRGVLDSKYDFVFACEVIEHFYHPKIEFALLRKLLRPGALLATMTQIFAPGMDFESWYYRRDPTHVSLYSARTFDWIKQEFGFQTVEIIGQRISLLRI